VRYERPVQFDSDEYRHGSTAGSLFGLAIIGHIAAGVLLVVRDRFDPCFILGRRKVVTSI
jgi:hypothetical protein